MSQVEETILGCAVNNGINYTQHRVSLYSEEKVWWKLAAEDRQENTSGGKEKM